MLPGDLNRIRRIREDRAQVVPAAFSVAAMARRVGVSEHTFRRWEQGVSRPYPRHARALARELGVSLDELGLDATAPEDDGVGQGPDHDEAEPGR